MLGLRKNDQEERIRIGGNGHKRLTLKQRLVRYLLRDAHIDELHIGAHSIVIDGDQIKMSALAADPGTPAEGWIWYLAGAVHKPRHYNGTAVKDIGEGATPGAHDLGGAEHNADTLANLNSKVSDATLDKNTDKRDPNAHKTTHENGGADEMSLTGLDGEPSTLTTHKDLTTGVHGAGANTLEHTGNKGAASGYMGLDAGSRGAQSPKLHATDHKSGGGDEVKLNELGAPTAAVAFNSQKATGLAAAAAAGDAIVADANVRAPDTTLLEGDTKATVQDHTPKAHLLGAHTADTLANLNTKISDATLDDASATRDPNSHDKSKHSDIDQSLLTSDDVAFAQVTVGDLVLKNGYRFTEHKKYGVVLKTPRGELYRLMVERCQRK